MIEENSLRILNSLNLHFDAATGFFICKICNTVLKSIRRHLKEAHKKFLPKGTWSILEQIVICNEITEEGVRYSHLPTKESLPMLFYLDIFDGFKCELCYYCARKEICLKNHKCIGDSSYRKVKVQVFFSFDQ